MRRPLFLIFWLLIALALIAGGCQPETGRPAGSAEQEPATADPGETVVQPTATIIAPTTEQEAGGDENGEQSDVVLAARADLARRSQRAPAEIEVISVTAMAWPDAGLGCPLPGADYAQEVTPGYLVLLTMSGEQYEYHTDMGQRTVLCGEDGAPILPELPADPDEIDDGQPWLPVD